MPSLFSCLGRPGIAPDTADAHPRRYVGLKNPTRTTCHLNAVLQALYMTPEIRSALLSLPSELPPTGRAVVNLFSQMAQGGRAVSTKTLSAALRPVYVCTRQQDCHDTWLTLCDQLEESLKETALSKLMSQVFEGKQLDYVRCHTCGTVVHTKDTFSNLSISVPNGIEVTQCNDSDTDMSEEEDEGEEVRSKEGAADAYAAEGGGGSGGGGGGGSSAGGAKADGEGGGGAARGEAHTLEKGLHELFTPEQMRGDDQYECDKCTGKHDAERGVRLRTMPPIVTIHLKRFAIQSRTDRKGRVELSLVKVNTAVTFPTVLDFRPFVDTSPSRPPSAAAAGSSAAGKGGGEPAGTAAAAAAAAAEGAPAAEAEEGRPSSLRYSLYAVLLHKGTLEKVRAGARARAGRGVPPWRVCTRARPLTCTCLSSLSHARGVRARGRGRARAGPLLCPHQGRRRRDVVPLRRRPRHEALRRDAAAGASPRVRRPRRDVGVRVPGAHTHPHIPRAMRSTPPRCAPCAARSTAEPPPPLRVLRAGTCCCIARRPPTPTARTAPPPPRATSRAAAAAAASASRRRQTGWSCTPGPPRDANGESEREGEMDLLGGGSREGETV